MRPVAIVTLIGTTITVLALATYLVRVALILQHVSFTLGTIIAGVRAIGHGTEPIGPVVREINEDLSQAQAALEAVLTDISRRREPVASPARPGVPDAGSPITLESRAAKPRRGRPRQTAP